MVRGSVTYPQVTSPGPIRVWHVVAPTKAEQTTAWSSDHAKLPGAQGKGHSYFYIHTPWVGKGHRADRTDHVITVHPFIQRYLCWIHVSYHPWKWIGNPKMKHTLKFLSYRKNNLRPKVRYPYNPLHYMLNGLNNHPQLGQLNQENLVSVSGKNFLRS